MTGVTDLLHELTDPNCYPHRPDRVDLVQTHISVVCLAGEFVYKLKKAVRLPFLDFGTAGRREHFCREELRLNQRLCPDVYLDVVPLVRTPSGLRFQAPGAALEHAVRMRRLPHDRMLDELLRAHRVAPADLARLAERMVAFHAGCARDPSVIAAGAPERLCALALANFDELQALPAHGIESRLLTALAAQTRADFDALLPVLARRAAEGRIVDGHGDLHARNICLCEPPAIYDCLEFSAELRCGDVATENAFLVMDLRYRGSRALATAYADAYAERSGDAGQQALLPALVRYRAIVRAKVAAMAAAERELPAADRDAARGSATRHCQLAAATAVEGQGPCWLLVTGVPGSGKSAVCRALAGLADWPHLATDVLRKELAGVPATARLGPEHYRPEVSERVYGELLARAGRLDAPVVLLDGNFPDPARRAQARAAALAARARLVVCHLEAGDEVALARLHQRAAGGSDASDAGPGQFAALRARYAPPTASEGFTLLAVPAAGELSAVVSTLLAAWLAGGRA